MWLPLLTFSGLSGCCLVALVFGLVRAGQRADKGEEGILRIILPALENKESIQKRRGSWSIPEVSVGKG